MKEGPQKITKRGEEPVFVISASELERIEGKKQSFIDFLLSAPGLERPTP